MRFETEYALQEWREIEPQSFHEDGTAYCTLGTDAARILSQMKALIDLLDSDLQSAETAMRDAQGQGTIADAWSKLEDYFDAKEAK
jgi:hypothetical protein